MAAALALTAALTLPIHPHTRAELADWEQDWAGRAVHGLDGALLDEWHDMRGRHPEVYELRSERYQLSPRVNVSDIPSSTKISTRVEQWRELVAAYFPASEVDRMLRIIACESGGDPSAVNPSSGTAGLLQIHPLWQKVWPGDYLDPWTNVAVGYQVWLEQGYGAWECQG